MYKTNLTEEIQRDMSENSSAGSTTHILEENRVEERRMGMLYNGGGLGQKGSATGQRSLVGFEGL